MTARLARELTKTVALLVGFAVAGFAAAAILDALMR
jgi:hypothetical protein